MFFYQLLIQNVFCGILKNNSFNLSDYSSEDEISTNVNGMRAYNPNGNVLSKNPRQNFNDELKTQIKTNQKDYSSDYQNNGSRGLNINNQSCRTCPRRINNIPKNNNVYTNSYEYYPAINNSYGNNNYRNNTPIYWEDFQSDEEYFNYAPKEHEDLDKMFIRIFNKVISQNDKNINIRLGEIVIAFIEETIKRINGSSEKITIKSESIFKIINLINKVLQTPEEISDDEFTEIIKEIVNEIVEETDKQEVQKMSTKNKRQGSKNYNEINRTIELLVDFMKGLERLQRAVKNKVPEREIFEVFQDKNSKQPKKGCRTCPFR